MVDFPRVLCPIDFSDASTHALEHAIALARWYGSHISAIHVEQPPHVVFEPPILFAERGGLKELSTDVEQLQNRLNNLMGAVSDAHVPWDARILEGAPADQIVEYARTHRASLIVLGTHGRAGFEHLVLGSVAEKVLRHAGCPVLTVPPRAQATSTLPYGRVLCAVDFSEPSIQALHVALSLAEEADAELTALHVVDWRDDETFLGQPFDGPDVREEFEARLKQRLEAFIPDEARVWSRPATKVIEGKAADQIVRVASDVNADLIVIGVQGRSALGMTLFGSTTNHVVRAASCPVLTIRYEGAGES